MAYHSENSRRMADNVDAAAMYVFTKGQGVRMRDTLAGPRRKLWTP